MVAMFLKPGLARPDPPDQLVPALRQFLLCRAIPRDRLLQQARLVP